MEESAAMVAVSVAGHFLGILVSSGSPIGPSPYLSQVLLEVDCAVIFLFSVFEVIFRSSNIFLYNITLLRLLRKNPKRRRSRFNPTMTL